MKMNAIFPAVIFESPDGWKKETIYATREDMEEAIRDLQTLGEEWKAISLDQCNRWEFWQIEGEQVVYRAEEQREDVFALFEATPPGYGLAMSAGQELSIKSLLCYA